MFDRHQAEITVMQFTGHSPPVYQSMTVHWDFNLSHIFKPVYAMSSHNCHRNVSLPSGASPWNGMFGRVEGQYTTKAGSTKEDLLTVIRDSWNSFDKEYCFKLVKCMPERIKIIIKS